MNEIQYILITENTIEQFWQSANASQTVHMRSCIPIVRRTSDSTGLRRPTNFTSVRNQKLLWRIFKKRNVCAECAYILGLNGAATDWRIWNMRRALYLPTRGPRSWFHMYFWCIFLNKIVNILVRHFSQTFADELSIQAGDLVQRIEGFKLFVLEDSCLLRH